MWYVPLLGITLQLAVTLYTKIVNSLDVIIPKMTTSINDKCCQLVSSHNIDEYVLIDEEYTPKLALVPVLQNTEVVETNYSQSINIDSYILKYNSLTQFWIISTVSIISLGLIKLFITFNSTSELIVGLVISSSVQKIFNLKYGRYMCINEIKKLLPFFVILPIILFVIRNYYDTYIIGLLIFNISSIVLYISQVFSMCFLELLRVTNLIYPNKWKLGLGWIGLIGLSLIL